VEIAMKLTRYESAGEFLKRARAFLEEQEAANNLIIGIAARAAEQPGVYKHGIYLATVDLGDEVVAAAVRTPPHRIVIYNQREDDLAPLRLILDDIIAFAEIQPPDSPARQISGVNAHSATALAFAHLWAERTGRGFKPGMSLRIYELREVNPPQKTPGHMRPAREDEFDLLAEWVYRFNVDCQLPEINREEAREIATRLLASGSIFFWEADGQVVSMAGRGRTSSHGITVNMVYTPPELRGRGYASACVAALSQQLLDNGWQFCTLYTDLANPTSNDIYQRIGYRPVCDSMEYVFDTP
jgi:predicted GNAT family acetyltransferase